MARRRKTADDAACASVNALQTIPLGTPINQAAPIDHAALFPGLRPRHDGWTAARTQRFLDTLAQSGCVEDACRVAGMSDTGARRMRERYPRFAEAWDAALARAERTLVAVAWQRAVEGKETVIIRKGKEFERRIAPSDALLSLLLKRGALAEGGIPATASPDPGRSISWEEWQDHWRFDDNGTKKQFEDPAKVQARLEARFAEMRERMFEENEDGSWPCPHCWQPLPGDPKQWDEYDWHRTGKVDFDTLFGSDEDWERHGE